MTVPGGHVWYLRALFASLVASATVATRLPVFTVTIDGAIVYVTSPVTGVTAGQTVRFSLANVGVEALNVDPRRLIIPELILPAGATIATTTAAIDAGDQWSAPAALIDDEWVKAGPIDLDRIEYETIAVVSPDMT